MSKGLAADAAAACETLSERERKTKQKRTLNPLPCCVPSRFFTHEKTQFRGGGGRCESSGSTEAIWRFAPAVLRVQGLASPWLRHACVLRQRSLLLRAARVTAARFLCLRAFRFCRLESIEFDSDRMMLTVCSVCSVENRSCAIHECVLSPPPLDPLEQEFSKWKNSRWMKKNEHPTPW